MYWRPLFPNICLTSFVKNLRGCNFVVELIFMLCSFLLTYLSVFMLIPVCHVYYYGRVAKVEVGYINTSSSVLTSLEYFSYLQSFMVPYELSRMLKRIKTRATIWPNYFTIEHIYPENSITWYRNTCASMFIVALFTVARKWNHFSCPSIEDCRMTVW